MHRLDRRLRILREKRNGAFDRDQYFLERALRSRAARKARHALRCNRPVVLITPRWSRSAEFLDDLVTDVKLGKPSIEARTLSLHPMHDRPVHEAWTWIVRGIVEFCGVELEGPAGQAVDRRGFRNVMRDVFGKVRTGRRRALFLHGLEYMHFEARNDLIQTFIEWREQVGDEARLNLLFGSSVDSPDLMIPGSDRVILADFEGAEATEALVEHLGPTDVERLEKVVRVVGGVPALLARLAEEAQRSGGLVTTRAEIFRALGNLSDEIRGAMDIVNSDAHLAERLEHLAQYGPMEREERDEILERAGLVQTVTWGRPGRVRVRAPVFAELALAATT